MAVEDLARLDVVPIEWGALVAASAIPNSNASALWFQDDAGTIRLLAFDHQTAQLWPKANVIPRNVR